MKKLVLLMVTVLLSGAFGLISTLNAQILSELTIGPGDLQDRIPTDFYWKNSLYQCIFTLEDLDGAAGYINSIAFYNNFNTTFLPPETDIRLYLAASTQSDLATAWIPASQMTLVFQGSLDLPNGQNQIRVDLPDSFLLPLDRNLVMMLERGFQASYYFENLPFFVQECPPANARKSYSDAYDFDPFNPPAPTQAQLIGRTPKTTLFYIPASVGSQDPSSPPLPDFKLSNYPNPFNPSTTISYSIKEATPVKLDIYNMKGQMIYTLIDQNQSKGEYNVVWNGKDGNDNTVASGVYYLRMNAGKYYSTRKMLRIRSQ